MLATVGSVALAVLGADLLVIVTDAVYQGWGSANPRAIAAAHPDSINPRAFPAGSMGPKVEAAAFFARSTGRAALIGGLSDINVTLAGRTGTRICADACGVHLRPAAERATTAAHTPGAAS